MRQEEKEANCKKKNDLYVSYITKLQKNDILPGVEYFLTDARAKGYKTGLGSASRNSMLILNRLGINGLFDVIIDGTKVSRAKPDPEVFSRGADELRLSCEQCIVFEDAVAGVQAAHNGGMKAVGIGSADILTKADLVISSFENMTVDDIIYQLERSLPDDKSYDTILN